MCTAGDSNTVLTIYFSSAARFSFVLKPPVSLYGSALSVVITLSPLLILQYFVHTHKYTNIVSTGFYLDP